MKKLYTSLLLGIVFCIAFVNSTKATPYYYVGAGASPTLPSSWNTNSLALAATSGSPSNFAGVNIWNFVGSGTINITSSWTVAVGATINCGDGTNALTVNLQISSIGTATNNSNQPQLNIKNNCTLVVQSAINFAPGKTNPNSGSTFIYDTGSSGVPAFINPYYNLTINNDIALTAVGVTVNGTLTLNSGHTLALNNLNLIINGKLAGSGNFIGDNSNGSSITFNTATGNIGTLNFQTGNRQLSGLTLNLGNSSSTLTLGNDLSIDGTNGGNGLTLTTGAINLNGHKLTWDNGSTATFGSGTIIGSSASSLLFNNVSAISGSLLMDATSNTLKALYLNDGGNALTLTLGNALNITDSVSAAAGTIASGSGNLTLLGTAALRGRIGMMGATGAISGSINSQVYFGRTYTGWRQMGVGGTSGNTLADWASQFPMTCTGCTYDPTSMSPAFYSVQGWDETTDDYVTSLTSATALTPGIGYWVYLGTGSSNTNPITITTTGAAVTGQVNVNITASNLLGDNNLDNYNLIANPYASPISWDAFMNYAGQGGNLMSNTGLIWDADTQTDVLIGSGSIIPAGQGVYVQAFNAATMTFDESMKTQDNTGSSTMLMRTAAQQNISGFELHVDGSLGDADETYFRFDPNASSGFDRLDAHKMFSTPNYQGLAGSSYSHYTSISSVYQAHKMILNTQPILTNSISVPVMVRVMATGSYTISVDNIQNYTSCTILKDNLTGVYHDLAQSPYVCTINDTTSAPRFELIMCAMSSPVSVKELNATASKISVYQDEISPLVATHFEQNTKATISVFNVIGQQLVKDLQVEGTDTQTRLNIDSHNEVLLIRVKTDKETVTTKIITH